MDVEDGAVGEHSRWMNTRSVGEATCQFSSAVLLEAKVHQFILKEPLPFCGDEV
jgi:hypothetical protein